MAMFVLGIGGTTRPNSSTEKALRVSLSAAEREGAETLLLGASDLQMPMYAPEDPDRSSEALRLIEELKRSDGIIVGSPGYHGTISGLVKNALDYTQDLADFEPPYFDGRAVGCVATATGWQATMTTLFALRSVVHALRGWPTPMGAAINTAGQIFDADGNCVDEAARFQLELVGQQVVWFARMRNSAG